jgi:hypothetical protein
MGVGMSYENCTPVAAISSPARVAGADRSPRLRARVTNDPLSGRASRHSAQGRRIGDLFDAFIAAMGNTTDALAQANALAAAEMFVAAEGARAKLLAGGDVEIEQVVKLQGAAARAERKLGIKPAVKPAGPSLAEYLAELAAKDAADAAAAAKAAEADQDAPS